MNSYSEKFTIKYWSYSEPYYYGYYQIPEITKNVIDKGIIQTFYIPSSSSEYENGFEIPSSWSLAENVSIYLETCYRVGEIEIQLSCDDYDYITNVNSLNFKVNIIAPEDFEDL